VLAVKKHTFSVTYFKLFNWLLVPRDTVWC